MNDGGMAGNPTTFRTRYATFRKAKANARELTISAVLTYPVTDLAGDFVHADGLTFHLHQADPWVDLEHNGSPVGWARKSLAVAGGEYSVRHAALDVDGTSHRLPIGTTHFDPDNRLQSQIFAMSERGALPGVSLEFQPVRGFMTPLGQSPTERRPAYEFLKADVVRWSHCAVPVCPGALTVTKSVNDALASVLSAGRIGDEQLHPTIKKALSQHLPPRSSVVGGFTVEKAMDNPETVYDDELPADNLGDPSVDGEPLDEGDDGPPLNGVDAHYQFVQALSDARDALQEAIKASDSPEMRASAEKLSAQLQVIEEKAKSSADKHDAKLNGGKDADAEADPDADPDATPDDADADDDEPDMSKDEDGTLKAVRPCYRKSLKAARVKRFAKADIEAAAVVVPAVDEDLAAAKAEHERARRRFRNAQLVYGGN